MGTTAVTIEYEYLLQATAEGQVESLSELAVQLREAEKREEAGRTDLPEVLVQLLQRATKGTGSETRGTSVHEQVGRVVANFVADNDHNRSRVLESGYVPVILAFIEGTLEQHRAESGEGEGQGRVGLDGDVEKQRQAARKASVASLLNLIIQGHEPSVELLGSSANLLFLSNISSGLYTRLLNRRDAGVKDGAEEEGPDEELLEGYEAVLGWIRTIIAAAVCDSKTDEALLPGTLDNLFLPILSPTNVHPTALDSGEDCFVLAAECLASVTSRKTAPELWITPFALRNSEYEHCYTAHAHASAHEVDKHEIENPLSALLVVIEYADGEGEEYAKAKANLTHALVDLGSILPLVPDITSSVTTAADEHGNATAPILTPPATHRQTLDKAFTTLCTWTDPSQRADLRMSALLTIGNAIVSNDISTALLDSARGQDLARNAIQALRPPATAQVQHASMGFLRNLSVAPKNKLKLGREEMGLWKALGEADVWGEGKDMVGSVQGGAVGLVKNLCRDTLPNVHTFLALPTATPSLLALSKRTDDPAIQFEIARIYVNCIRAVFASKPDASRVSASSGSSDPSVPLPDDSSRVTATSPEALQVLTSEGVIHIISNMLGQSAQYPVLANEAIIALALLATFGGDAADTTISTSLQTTSILDVLHSILCPTADVPSSRETRANAITLIQAKGLQEACERVRTRLLLLPEGKEGEMSDEGRALCASGERGD